MASEVGESFEEVVLPHLDSAYRLARWLLRNEDDAQDVVQEASLRAIRYFRTFTGGDGRAWFLRIVRNTCWSWHGHSRQMATDQFDEEQHSEGRSTADPEALAIRTDAADLVARMIGRLPGRFRELLVLREFEGLSYKELAQVFDIPMGSVMSGLSRARQAARRILDEELRQSSSSQRRPLGDRDADAVLV